MYFKLLRVCAYSCVL